MRLCISAHTNTLICKDSIPLMMSVQRLFAIPPRNGVVMQTQAGPTLIKLKSLPSSGRWGLGGVGGGGVRGNSNVSCMPPAIHIISPLFCVVLGFIISDKAGGVIGVGLSGQLVGLRFESQVRW